ncbi:MAG: tRNA (guanosine(37)-N1)-methyltransferase TrmD [Candidatus Hydrothermales bacterium]
MNIYVITLFPDFFEKIKEFGPIKRAILSDSLRLKAIDIRKFAEGPKEVDDRPYGGGGGMVIRVDVVVKALRSIEENALKILLDARGEILNQKLVHSLLKNESIVLICGRYKGIDERIRSYVDAEISIGDYVLSGGEPAAYVIIDTISRLLPGSMGEIDSREEDSFEKGILGYPVYTKPREFEGKKVPTILFSGNHAEIKRYLKKESLKETLLKRKDLLDKVELSEEDKLLLREIENELKKKI